MNTGGIAATNSFLVADETTGKAVIFDAPNDTVRPLLEIAQKEGWDVIGLWLTHGHFDHVADHAEVRAAYPKAKVCIHFDDANKLRNPQAYLPWPIPVHIPPTEPDVLLHDADTLQLGSLAVNVIHTPGHDPGHVVFHFPSEKVLVGGDMIIGGSVGRTDLDDSDHRLMGDSLRRILKLPDDTRLLPGHGEPSTLGQEKKTNQYLEELSG